MRWCRTSTWRRRTTAPARWGARSRACMRACVHACNPGGWGLRPPLPLFTPSHTILSSPPTLTAGGHSDGGAVPAVHARRLHWRGDPAGAGRAAGRGRGQEQAPGGEWGAGGRVMGPFPCVPPCNTVSMSIRAPPSPCPAARPSASSSLPRSSSSSAAAAAEAETHGTAADRPY